MLSVLCAQVTKVQKIVQKAGLRIPPNRTRILPLLGERAGWTASFDSPEVHGEVASAQPFLPVRDRGVLNLQWSSASEIIIERQGWHREIVFVLGGGNRNYSDFGIVREFQTLRSRREIQGVFEKVAVTVGLVSVLLMAM